METHAAHADGEPARRSSHQSRRRSPLIPLLGQQMMPIATPAVFGGISQATLSQFSAAVDGERFVARCWCRRWRSYYAAWSGER